MAARDAISESPVNKFPPLIVRLKAELNWSSEEKLALLEAMQVQCPEGDRLSYSARVSKMDWQTVKVEGHTPEQCQEAWLLLSAKVRKFRTLGELMEDAKDVVLHPNKHLDNKKRKIKHPDQPTKPLTPYFRFLQDNREKFKAENPDVNTIELTRALSQQWQNLEPEKQDKYIKKYKKQWAKFKEANDKFLEEHPELNPRQTKPKPPTPCGLYIKSKTSSLKEKHPEMDNLQVQRKLQHKYSKLSPEKKKKWIQKALDAVPEYEERIKDYQRYHPDFEPPFKKVRLTKAEAVLNGDVIEPQKSSKTKKPKFPGAPKKAPRSAFHLFVTKKMGSLEGGMKEKMQTLGPQWQGLGSGQNKYHKKLKKQKKRYAIELQAFKETLSAEELTAFEESLKPVRKAKTRRKDQVDDSTPMEIDE